MRKVLNSRIFKIIYTIFVIIFVMFIGLYLLFACLEGKKIFDYILYTVPDNSMRGSYEKQDVLILKEPSKLILEVGNDVAYYGTSGGLEGRLIIHRIVKIDNTDKKDIMFVTQGIKDKVPDPPIHKKEIIGKVMGKASIINEINHLIKSQLGSFLLVFLPLTLILSIEIVKTVIAMKLEKTTIEELEELKNDRGSNEKKRKDKE
ncbi:MAG: hypothetical protein IJI58_05815 [Bacilli bacterium]|nr:hypothetical protein [Bacilli bacterium]